jgi:predicted membrane-bound spermidine synthase
MRESLRLPLAFFASGAAALLFEVLWFRALGRLLGNTVWSAALVLAAFMLGIALGGLLAARWAGRIRRPARAFALAEAAVALSGSLLVWSAPALEASAAQWLAPLEGQPGPLAAARLVAALGALLVPTTAMGMTLALGVRALARTGPGTDTVRALGILYAANTFGACIAPIAAEYYLIGALGLRGTALFASALNLLAAGIALRLAAAPQPPAPAAGDAPLRPRLLAAAAIAGALALALEVVWFRLLVLYTPASDSSFAIMLTLMLVGIALGGFVAPLLARVPWAWLAAAGSLAVVLGYVLAAPSAAIEWMPQLLHYAIPLMLPAAVVSGSLFTLLGAQLGAGAENPQPAVGRLTSANTLGAAAGSALAALVLLPQLGIERSLFVLAAGYALLPLVLLARGAWRSALPALLGAAGLAAFPFGRMDAHLAQAVARYQALDGGSKVVRVTQGATTTLQVLRYDRYGGPVTWRLVTDSYSMSAITRSTIRYMQLFAWLPLALHGEPRRALLISYGAGNTAQALLSDPGLRELVVVDVSPEILAASSLLHAERDPLRDPRVRLVLEDGRHYLRSRREQFDIITGEPPPPMMAGVVNLYTREYFRALAERLAPGGLATYWLPVYQFDLAGAKATAAAFCDAFADCTLWAGANGEWILLGGRGFERRASAEDFARLWHAAAQPYLLAGGLEHPVQIGATFLADAAQLREWIGRTPPVVDDFPKRLGADLAFRSIEPYAAWQRPASARERFAASRWIAAHWPAELARASLPYFDLQPILNGEQAPDPAASVPLVDLLLRRSNLRIPILWLLDSDTVEQAVVERRLAAAGAQPLPPELAYPLGVRALAERDYRRAAPLLAVAAERDPRTAGPIAAYALCRAGLKVQSGALPSELSPATCLPSTSSPR